MWPEQCDLCRNENLWNTLLSILKHGNASPWTWRKIPSSTPHCSVFKSYLHARYHSGESQRYARSTVVPFRICFPCRVSKSSSLCILYAELKWTYRWLATVHAGRARIVHLRGGDVVLWDPVASTVNDDAGANSWPAALSPSVRFGDYFFNDFLHCGSGVSWTLVSRYNVS